MGVRLVAQGQGGGSLYIAETDDERGGLKLCRLYYADRDYLVPDWRLPLGSFVAHSDPWDVEAVTLPEAERERNRGSRYDAGRRRVLIALGLSLRAGRSARLDLQKPMHRSRIRRRHVPDDRHRLPSSVVTVSSGSTFGAGWCSSPRYFSA